jgi:hypothetical protein
MEFPCKLVITCIFTGHFAFKMEQKFEKNVVSGKLILLQNVCNHQNTTRSIKVETSNWILMNQIHSERISTSIFLWILLHNQTCSI